MRGLGFLLPGTGPDGRGRGAMDDYDLLAGRTRVPARPASVPIDTDLHRVPVLRALNDPRRLAAAARRLGPVDAVVWACTSASFVLGLAGARRQATELADALGVPASSTALAFVAACEHLRVGTVAVAASYPPALTRHFVALLRDAGVATVTSRSAGIHTADEVSRLPPARVRELARRAAHPDADAVLVPDTAMPTASVLEDLDRDVDVPVLTANQVTFWHALRLARWSRPVAGLGTLSTT